MNGSRVGLFALLAAGPATCAMVYAQSPAPPSIPSGATYVPVPYYGAAPPPLAPPAASHLAQQLLKAEKNDEKQDLRKKLDEMLQKEFDQHLQHQEKELEELEKQLAQLRGTLKKRKDAKESIIRRRAEQLINEAEGLGWTGPSGPRRGATDFPNAFGSGGSWGRSGYSTTPQPVQPRPGTSSSYKLEGR